MKFFRLAMAIILVLSSVKVKAQSDYIQLGSRQYDVLDRLEVKLRKDSVLNFSLVKPYTRQSVTLQLQNILKAEAEGKVVLSKVDKYNIDILLKDNFEYREGFGDSTLKFGDMFSKKVFKNPPYVGVKKGDFSAYITPVLNFEFGKDNNLGNSLFRNTRGIYMRGTLAKGIGFYTYFTENQERDPLYVQQYVTNRSAVPGNGYYKTGFKGNGYDFFDARGGIMFKIAKGIDGQFAYDKAFIGNGYRSLILSDFSSNYLFLKLNARIWKFNYNTMFAQLTSNYQRANDRLLPKKFMAFHSLDLQATKWLNIGLFEDVMFGRTNGNGFDLNYLNPVIFYRSIEQQLGSPDKVTLGLNIKANAFKNTQLYSQIIINEFLFEEVKNYSRGDYRNKHALQIGLKTIDLFGIKNLDVQLEGNLIRPFVYTHYDSVGSFTHYNQPLAHPMGANLREFIAIVKYQPINKLTLKAKLIYNEQGLDSAGFNFGSNITRFYTRDKPTNNREKGFKIGSGDLAKLFIGSISASYELIPNMFIDATALIRNYKVVKQTDFNTNTFTFGIRMNMQKREFDF